jgi:predicted DNA-binding transcriptional regulator YafY
LQRLERLVLMIQEINNGRTPSVDSFCKMFEVAPRTVHADIAYLRDMMGYPIEWDAYHKGYRNTDPSKQLPQFELNEGEIFALVLGKNMLSEYSGTTFEPILRSAIDKISERLPEKVRLEHSELAGIVQFKPGGIIDVSRKTFFDFSRACESKLVIEMVYFSAHDSQSTFRQIEPYRLVESRGAWYAVGWCRLRGGMRIFALHRITEYKLLDERFQSREGTEVDAYLNEAFQLEVGDPLQMCVIKFDRASARYIRERQWHRSQVIVEHEDGGCTLSFGAARLDEVKRWVLTYGASAEVLQPPKLRQIVQKEFDKGSARYAKSGKPMQRREKRQAAKAVRAPSMKVAETRDIE